ncbi:MAG TPA: hypothetical protein VGL66_10525 [Caulobacteraceae bacterium]|jgi:hypothetical protein
MHRLTPTEVFKAWWAIHPGIPFLFVVTVLLLFGAGILFTPTGPMVHATGRVQGLFWTAGKSYNRPHALVAIPGGPVVNADLSLRQQCSRGDRAELTVQPHIWGASNQVVACRPAAQLP